MSISNNIEEQCFKRVWKKTIKSVFNSPKNAVMTAKTKSVQQVNINLKKKRARRRRKKNKNKNVCEFCMDSINITNSLSTFNTKGTLFLHRMPWDCLNTVCLNGMQFANMNSLKSFLRYI